MLGSYQHPHFISSVSLGFQRQTGQRDLGCPHQATGCSPTLCSGTTCRGLGKTGNGQQTRASTQKMEQRLPAIKISWHGPGAFGKAGPSLGHLTAYFVGDMAWKTGHMLTQKPAGSYSVQTGHLVPGTESIPGITGSTSNRERYYLPSPKAVSCEFNEQPVKERCL